MTLERDAEVNPAPSVCYITVAAARSYRPHYSLKDIMLLMLLMLRVEDFLAAGGLIS